MPLSDPEIKSLRPGEKTTRHWDAGGLYLELTPTGAKKWRFKYRFQGKEKLLSVGLYPTVPLKQARILRDEMKVLLTKGLDPSVMRKAKKASSINAKEGCFEIIAREWLEQQSPVWANTHAKKVVRRMEKDVFPWIGNRPATEIQAPDLLAVFRRIESRGAKDTAHRAAQTCSQIFRFAISIGKATRDPVADLRGALAPVQQSHFPTIIDPIAIGGLLRAIESYTGAYVTRFALQLAPLVILRPGELRHGEWSEVNFETAEWRIVAEKMKGRAYHVIPLSRQALHVLNEVYPLTRESRYIFPSARSIQRPMSEGAVIAALRRMGYQSGDMTGHGFRSMASTLLNESGKWSRDAIERQLAHGERNAIRAAYNHAEYLSERREMMQWWADYLDNLKDSTRK